MADLNTFLSRLLYSRLPLIGGSGGSASGVLTVNTTSAGTIADTNETDLWTYSMPANMLDINGRTLRVSAWGTTGATANNKTIKLYFAGTPICALVGAAANDQSWQLQMMVVRTGASSQAAINAMERVGSTISSGNRALTPSADTTTALTIKVTGQNGTAAANDVVFKGAVVELIN